MAAARPVEPGPGEAAGRRRPARGPLLAGPTSRRESCEGAVISRGKEFLFTHDLDRLLLGLEELGLEITEALDEAAILTRYALETRYPGGFEPVTASEYREAIHHAEVVLAWVSGHLQPGS